VLKVGRIDPNDSLPLTTAKEQIFLLGVCAEKRLGMRLSCQQSEVLETQYLKTFFSNVTKVSFLRGLVKDDTVTFSG
jgi:hypothetical protein